MGGELIPVATVLLGSALTLAGLWLRLRFQLRAERERRRYLLTAATALPAGSRVHEQRGDGSRLTLTVGARPSPCGDRDE